jgi:glycosyltransferase involved in cell wall biosynthesis
VIDRTYTRSEVYGLIQCCDCLVSLHRSEGFGLTIAEAMYLGKPVIVTAYSGNMDFTLPENSFLVDYQMTRVGPGSEPYNENCLWADPNVEEAARVMRNVVRNAEERRRIAAYGQAFVRRRLSPANVGEQMKARLSTLHSGNNKEPTLIPHALKASAAVK